MHSAELHAETERSPLWDRIRKLEHDNNRASGRIGRLEADLQDCREYLEKEMDVVDGSYGEPSPNRAMQLVNQIDETLDGPGAR